MTGQRGIRFRHDCRDVSRVGADDERAQITVKGGGGLFRRAGENAPWRRLAPAADTAFGVKPDEDDFDTVGNQTGAVITR